jgi:DNA-binding MarR family transcriptional regulator
VSRAPDITRLLDKLEECGYIERDRPADNRRTVRIGITKSGMKLLRELRRPLRLCHHRQLGHLTSNHLRRLVGLLRTARLPHEPETSTWR